MALQVVDLIKEYNALGRNCIAIMLDTKGPEVRSGDLSAPIDLVAGVRRAFLPSFLSCPAASTSSAS